MARNIYGQLPMLNHLKHFGLSPNNLQPTDVDLKKIPKLTSLHIHDKKLSRKQCGDLFQQLYSQGSLEKLQKLDLSHNTLTGYLSNILPDPLQKSYPRLTELSHLYLRYTKLNKDDLQHLTQLIKTEQLPKLSWFDLDHTVLGETDELAELIKVCVSYHRTGLQLWLQGTELSTEFKRKWTNYCLGTHVQAWFSGFQEETKTSKSFDDSSKTNVS